MGNNPARVRQKLFRRARVLALIAVLAAGDAVRSRVAERVICAINSSHCDPCTIYRLIAVSARNPTNGLALATVGIKRGWRGSTVMARLRCDADELRTRQLKGYPTF
jgi:hypothetical protein